MKFRIDLKIIFFLVLFYLTHQIKLYILIMLFCLIHECAHMVIAVSLGFKVKEIELIPFGFFININPKFKDYSKKVLNSNIVELKKIFIACAGPIMNIIIIFCIGFINSKFSELIIYINLVIIIFNLIPIFPLDGGRVLKSLFSLFYGNKKANSIINKISNCTIICITACASISILYLKNVAILFILIYLWDMVIRENKKFYLQKKAYESINSNL